MIKRIWNRLWTREVITYLIAGVLTTAVNFLASYFLYNIMDIEENLTTAIAWVIAVVFAYIINNSWVFRKGNEGARRETIKATKFVTARLFTYFVEAGGIYLFKTRLGFDYWYVKIPLAIIVTILNYIFSKIFIFISGKKEERENTI